VNDVMREIQSLGRNPTNGGTKHGKKPGNGLEFHFSNFVESL